MDDKGLIFTTDSILALAVVIVLTASLMTYFYAPVYMGADHQHLEELADSALAVMEQDGTLTNAAAEAHKGNTSGAQQIINSRLRMLIPQEIAYNLTLSTPNLVSVQNDRGILYAQDTATKVRVLSFPREGWMGRAWYKIEKFEFENQTQNVTTTLWNFHNWLTNFAPWNTNSGNLATTPLWGSTAAAPTTPINTTFSFPIGSTIKGAKYLSGSCSRNTTTLIQAPSFGTNFTLNSQVYTANSSQYTFLYRRPSQNYPMYNYQGNINVTHLANSNRFNLRFIAPVFNYVNTNNQGNDMPWFSIIGNYSTSFPVPKGIISTTHQFPDGAGMAVQTAQDLGGGAAFGRIYNLNTGSVSNIVNQRVITWNNFRLQDASNVAGQNYQNGVPFVMTNVVGATGTSVTATKCAVSVSQTINVPTGNTIFDVFTVVNPYGGVDGALVEVYNGSTWRTVFCSFNYDGATYSARADGYGNIPGIVYIPPSYLSTGQNNQIRVTIWDDVPSTDYDLVGLVDCYSKVTYSALNIGWVTTPYTSYQSNNNVRTETRSFSIEENAKNVYLFIGAGLDTRNITVNYPGGAVLYNGTTLPYYLDLAAIDAGLPVAQRKITTVNSTPTNYTLQQGNNYNLTVTVNGPTHNWQSGDWDSNAEIFSGTRIAVIYPETLRNVWTDAYDANAVIAMDTAKQRLITALNTTDPNIINAIKTEALFTGDLPNQVPVRLSLWRR